MAHSNSCGTEAMYDSAYVPPSRRQIKPRNVSTDLFSWTVSISLASFSSAAFLGNLCYLDRERPAHGRYC